MPNPAVGEALLICDAVARDPGGKVTLYGIFERIWAPRFPAVHPILSVYWKCRVPSAGRVGIRILKPDGSTLMELEPVESGRQTPHTMQGTYTLSPVEFPTDGAYSLVLRYNDQDILSTDVQVAKTAEP
jgi:hypothetical protein